MLADELKVQFADSEIASIDKELPSLLERVESLRALRAAWEVIREQSLRHSAQPAPITFAEPQPSAAEEAMEATAAYGDKTQALRRFVVESHDTGVTRYQIVEKSKTLDAHPNFPYRFITRMVDSGELLEIDGKFFATDKMRDKLRPVAA